MLKLGKLPARPNAVKLKLANYQIVSIVPPKRFGHYLLVADGWKMLGNDRYGDCVFAGAAHETQLWNREAAKTVIFTDQDVLSDYSAVTGFNPNDPSTDNGTDMQAAASYRKKVGIRAQDKRHQVAAYLALRVGDVDELKLAIYLFSAVGLGFEFPNYAMDEFNAGQSWHLKTGGHIIGGHYVPAVGYDGRYIYTVTWGKVQKMSYGFLRRYMDEGIVYLSNEMLTGDKSLEGFDFTELQYNLAKL